MQRLSRRFETAVQPLVDAALARNAADRRAWLAELRADCPSVTWEVERLLQRALGSPQISDVGCTVCDVVPGSLESLGLRC